ncbi:cell adhesion molecule 2-like [Anneissia japonica]|uniref:cell adhesion molecule 2-like n=1 Tax=Anneissia japonica TaxID=1529436 RepID=UPI001425B957|nr:cell adhesion molecule 2-like [Anneissia japonica]
MHMGLLMFLLFLACIYPSSSFTEFRFEPQNNRQPEGGVAYFTCMVVDLNDMEYVSWIYGDEKISEDGIILDNQLDERYNIDGNALLGTFNLHIRNVQREDSGQFVCTVFNRENHLIAQSQPANLTVLQIPREHYPLCSPISASYKIGENIVVTCRSEITNPLADLTWKRNDAEVRSSQVETSIKTDAYIISYSFIASKNDQGSMFICEMTTPANIAIRRNCSTGPINVLYAPHVRIEQTDVAMLGKEAIFICYSDSNPPEVTFEWNINSQLNEDMYTLENERILRILHTQKDINGTIIECKVTNSIGSRSQTFKILIFNSGSKDAKSPLEKTKIKTGIEENNLDKEKTNSKRTKPETIDPVNRNKKNKDFSISLIIAIAVACIIVILGLALIPVGYMRYTRRQPNDTVSRGRPVSIPDVYFEPKDHVDPMLPQLGLAAPWMRTVGVQVPGECEYDVTYTQVSPQSRQAYYSQRMYTAASL